MFRCMYVFRHVYGVYVSFGCLACFLALMWLKFELDGKASCGGMYMYVFRHVFGVYM
jgi:hypothetical protein